MDKNVNLFIKKFDEVPIKFDITPEAYSIFVTKLVNENNTEVDFNSQEFKVKLDKYIDFYEYRNIEAISKYFLELYKAIEPLNTKILTENNYNLTNFITETKNLRLIDFFIATYIYLAYKDLFLFNDINIPKKLFLKDTILSDGFYSYVMVNSKKEIDCIKLTSSTNKDAITISLINKQAPEFRVLILR